MRRHTLYPLPLLAATLLATALPVIGVLAQMPMTPPGSANPAGVVAGTYKVEPDHTQVVFAVDHMGFSLYRGDLSGAAGSLTIDPAALGKTALSVTVPVGSIHTTSARLDGELVSADWFDARKYPQASFVSTHVTPGPDGTARIDGTLTLHGVSKPATLLARFHGGGANPMSKAATIGFDGQLSFSRSDFGVTKYVPLVADRVNLTIAAAFEKAG